MVVVEVLVEVRMCAKSCTLSQSLAVCVRLRVAREATQADEQAFERPNPTSPP